MTAGDLAQEVYNQVCESETSLHRTCYTLHMTGPSSALADHVAVPVDPFQELKAVEPIRLYLETHFVALAAAATTAASGPVTNGKANTDDKSQQTQAPSGESSSEKSSQGQTPKNVEETSSASGVATLSASDKMQKEKLEAGGVATTENEKEGPEEKEGREVEGSNKSTGKRGGRRGQAAQGGAAGKHFRAHARWLKSSGLLDGGGGEPAPAPAAATPPLPQAPPLVFTLVEGAPLSPLVLEYD